MSDDYPITVPYVGPVNIYDRYMRGEVITRNDLLTDQSEWMIRAMDARDYRRLRWMLDNMKEADDE